MKMAASSLPPRLQSQLRHCRISLQSGCYPLQTEALHSLETLAASSTSNTSHLTPIINQLFDCLFNRLPSDVSLLSVLPLPNTPSALSASNDVLQHLAVKSIFRLVENSTISIEVVADKLLAAFNSNVMHNNQTSDANLLLKVDQNHQFKTSNSIRIIICNELIRLAWMQFIQINDQQKHQNVHHQINTTSITLQSLFHKLLAIDTNGFCSIFIEGISCFIQNVIKKAEPQQQQTIKSNAIEDLMNLLASIVRESQMYTPMLPIFLTHSIQILENIWESTEYFQLFESNAEVIFNIVSTIQHQHSFLSGIDALQQMLQMLLNKHENTLNTSSNTSNVNPSDIKLFLYNKWIHLALLLLERLCLLKCNEEDLTFDLPRLLSAVKRIPFDLSVYFCLNAFENSLFEQSQFWLVTVIYNSLAWLLWSSKNEEEVHQLFFICDIVLEKMKVNTEDAPILTSSKWLLMAALLTSLQKISPSNAAVTTRINERINSLRLCKGIRLTYSWLEDAEDFNLICYIGNCVKRFVVSNMVVGEDSNKNEFSSLLPIYCITGWLFEAMDTQNTVLLHQQFIKCRFHMHCFDAALYKHDLMGFVMTALIRSDVMQWVTYSLQYVVEAAMVNGSEAIKLLPVMIDVYKGYVENDLKSKEAVSSNSTDTLESTVSRDIKRLLISTIASLGQHRPLVPPAFKSIQLLTSLGAPVGVSNELTTLQCISGMGLLYSYGEISISKLKPYVEYDKEAMIPVRLKRLQVLVDICRMRAEDATEVLKSVQLALHDGEDMVKRLAILCLSFLCENGTMQFKAVHDIIKKRHAALLRYDEVGGVYSRWGMAVFFTLYADELSEKRLRWKGDTVAKEEIEWRNWCMEVTDVMYHLTELCVLKDAATKYTAHCGAATLLEAFRTMCQQSGSTLEGYIKTHGVVVHPRSFLPNIFEWEEQRRILTAVHPDKSIQTIKGISKFVGSSISLELQTLLIRRDGYGGTGQRFSAEQQSVAKTLRQLAAAGTPFLSSSVAAAALFGYSFPVAADFTAREMNRGKGKTPSAAYDMYLHRVFPKINDIVDDCRLNHPFLMLVLPMGWIDFMKRYFHQLPVETQHQEALRLIKLLQQKLETHYLNTADPMYNIFSAFIAITKCVPSTAATSFEYIKTKFLAVNTQNTINLERESSLLSVLLFVLHLHGGELSIPNYLEYCYSILLRNTNSTAVRQLYFIAISSEIEFAFVDASSLQYLIELYIAELELLLSSNAAPFLHYGVFVGLSRVAAYIGKWQPSVPLLSTLHSVLQHIVELLSMGVLTVSLSLCKLLPILLHHRAIETHYAVEILTILHSHLNTYQPMAVPSTIWYGVAVLVAEFSNTPHGDFPNDVYTSVGQLHELLLTWFRTTQTGEGTSICKAALHGLDVLLRVTTRDINAMATPLLAPSNLIDIFGNAPKQLLLKEEQLAGVDIRVLLQSLMEPHREAHQLYSQFVGNTANMHIPSSLDVGGAMMVGLLHDRIKQIR